MSSPAPDPPTSDQDSLASLEERIRRTVDLVNQLRLERDAAVAERDASRNAAGAAMSDLQKLRQEIDELRGERKQVRTRIEKLLGQMDLLSGS
jgi:FtsZ-binding cell division protein ZapB